MCMQIRRYRPGEEAAIWDVYYSSNHSVVAQEYTSEQVRRWAPDAMDLGEWADRLLRTRPFVAIVADRIVGFAEIERDGRIDYFYCHADSQRQGVGTALMDRIEQEAIDTGAEKLSAEVSTTAVHFFLAHDFRVITERNAVVCNAPARQYVMEKTLTVPGSLQQSG